MTARQRLPFFPHWLIAGKEEAVPSGMRPFGSSSEDLAIDFRLARRPALITQLLAQCSFTAHGQAVDPDLLLELPAGMRIEALLTLAALSDSTPFSWRVRCASPSCGEENEFELSVDRILSLAAGQRERQTMTIMIGEDEVILRRPTGHDQMQWLSESRELESETMLRAILVRPALEEMLEKGETFESIASAVDQAMDDFDPLPGFHLDVVCPQCSAGTEVFPDLAGSALERLSRAQHAAIRDVHSLASQYHWSERQILDLPEWRRQSYLQLIEGMAF